MSPKGGPTMRAAVMPRGKQPIKPGAGRMPGAMPRKQAPTAKIMPVGKPKSGGTAIKPMPVVGNKIMKSLPVKPGSKTKADPGSKNQAMLQTAQQVKNTSNIKKSKMVSKSAASRNQDIMKALGK